MKIKLLSLVLLTLSLSACGVKVFKTKAQSPENTADITLPPEIAASKDEAITVRSDPNEAISYGEWLKENSKPSEDAE